MRVAKAEVHSFPPEVRARENLLRRFRVVAKTRFNAHKRLEAKASAANLGLQITNLYTIAIGILLIQFPASELLKPSFGALNYVSLLASVFVQIMALIESLKDYSGRAKSMHDCGLKVSALYQALELDPRTDWVTLGHYDAAYQRILQDTDVNHDDIDYDKQQLDEARKSRASSTVFLRSCRFWILYVWNVYALTAMILVSPALVLWALVTWDVR
jgi:hypothetical protein